MKNLISSISDGPGFVCILTLNPFYVYTPFDVILLSCFLCSFVFAMKKIDCHLITEAKVFKTLNTISTERNNQPTWLFLFQTQQGVEWKLFLTIRLNSPKTTCYFVTQYHINFDDKEANKRNLKSG